ncbi:MAG: ABC transporter substrate-binding protein [Clostridium sp.]|uniref:ABC transporter substrate-binding protein n=1 Tax=Clostridium TaxID=1485 RepID=UPI00115ABD13|nr:MULTISPECIES: ABC transporter substrate-binding protein [Clostridium]MBS5884438.1 carbohydrate ABC transporter substrate-binding protein [Clostridium sp.]MDU7147756.1 ABC transporter substrate-binding protein [Clostridium sp.]MDU7241647.1 ABC transporter substrate-binding protein [Clostridium sp.]
MKKKLISTICLSIFAMTLFAGCSSKGTSKEEGVTLKVLTHRTDIVDTTLKKIGDEYFEKTGVKIEWEGITDYEGVVKTRMNTQDYGDVLNILPAITSTELSQFFEPLGTVDELKDYQGVTQRAADDTVYGLPNGLGATGIVYNKKVVAQAGYNEFPKTVDELYDLADKLAKMGGIVPLAINSKDKWPLGQYDSVASVVYGNPYYYRDMGKMDDALLAGKPTGDVLEILYKFVSSGWVEGDLTTTNWEQSKSDMANGKVAMMALGMWAVPQIQGISSNPDDIGIAPFPVNNSGELKAEAGPDQFIAVSSHSKHKEEAKDFVKFYTTSGYADSEGLIPAKKEQESKNPVVKGYQESGVELMLADPEEADPAASDLTTEIANNAGIKFWEGSYIQEAVIAAKKSRSDFDAVVKKYNDAWNKSKAASN